MCEIKEEKFEVEFFVMEDKDLAVSVILGLDFLQKSKMVLDFNTLQFHLPDVAQNKCTFPFYSQNGPSNNHFYMAVMDTDEPPIISEADHNLIVEAAMHAETTPEIQARLKDLMLEWPTVCTQNIGRTNVIRHQIITTDQQPVRKKPYKVSVFRNDFIEGQVKELFEKKIIQPSTSPWASPPTDVSQDGAEDGSRVASSGKTLQFFVCFICFFVVLRVRCC